MLKVQDFGRASVGLTQNTVPSVSMTREEASVVSSKGSKPQQTGANSVSGDAWSYRQSAPDDGLRSTGLCSGTAFGPSG